MITKQCPSYSVRIYMAGDAALARVVCKDYCDAVGYCVTVTETDYIYRDGPDADAGIVVGLINYPRFEALPASIWHHATTLAAQLCFALKQQSYTIEAPDKTVWFSHREADQ